MVVRSQSELDELLQKRPGRASVWTEIDLGSGRELLDVFEPPRCARDDMQGLTYRYNLEVSSGRAKLITRISRRWKRSASQHLLPKLGERVAQRSTGNLHQPFERTVQLFDQKDRAEDR